MRILLADDEPRVRFGLKVLLQRQPGLAIVGEAVDALDLLTKIEMTAPDLALVAWELPGLPAIGSLAALHRRRSQLAVIALSGRPEVGQMALAAGADAFVSKADPPEAMLRTIMRFGVEAARDTVASRDSVRG